MAWRSTSRASSRHPIRIADSPRSRDERTHDPPPFPQHRSGRDQARPVRRALVCNFLYRGHPGRVASCAENRDVDAENHDRDASRRSRRLVHIRRRARRPARLRPFLSAERLSGRSASNPRRLARWDVVPRRPYRRRHGTHLVLPAQQARIPHGGRRGVLCGPYRALLRPYRQFRERRALRTPNGRSLGHDLPKWRARAAASQPTLRSSPRGRRPFHRALLPAPCGFAQSARLHYKRFFDRLWPRADHGRILSRAGLVSRIPRLRHDDGPDSFAPGHPLRRVADFASQAVGESGLSGLGAHLERLIALKGPLSLAEFMIESLWHPSEGYYAQSAAIGRSGDYVTAPEIGQMFGELIGVWCVAASTAMGRPVPFELIELGPGRGTMMADALRAARVEHGFHQAARIHLVEASAKMREVQRILARDRDVTWHDSFGTVPEGPTILVANEFLDALPIVQFERTESGWRERLVEFDKASGRFRFVRAQHEAPAAALLPPAFACAAPGSIAELCPAALSLAASLASRLAREGGAALFIDYGPRESTLG